MSALLTVLAFMSAHLTVLAFMSALLTVLAFMSALLPSSSTATWIIKGGQLDPLKL